MSDNAPPTAGEVRALAHQLLSWAEQLSAMPVPASMLSEGEQKDLMLAIAEAARDAALLRTRFFPGLSLGNVTWDVMLELFVRTEKGFRVSQGNLELERDVPAAAIARSIDELRDLALITETADRFDPRVIWLSLSGEGHRRMTAMLLESARFVSAQRRVTEAPAPAARGFSRSA